MASSTEHKPTGAHTTNYYWLLPKWLFPQPCCTVTSNHRVPPPAKPTLFPCLSLSFEFKKLLVFLFSYLRRNKLKQHNTGCGKLCWDTSSFSLNESTCFFISYTTAGVSPASMRIFFSRPCSLGSVKQPFMNFSGVRVMAQILVFNAWYETLKSTLMVAYIRDLYACSLLCYPACPTYLFSMDDRSNPSAPASSAPEMT